MAEKLTRAPAQTPQSASGAEATGKDPINVMAQRTGSPSTMASGCSDLRHPNLPYWHPLNGPFPSD